MKCPECSGKVCTDHSNGEDYCTECGLIVTDTKFDRGEPHSEEHFDNLRNKQHYGKSNDDDLSVGNCTTKISSKINGKSDNSKRRRKWRLSFWDNISEEYRTSSLKEVMQKIKTMANKLNIPPPSMQDMAKYYKKSFDENLTQGRMEEVVLSSVIYLVCRRDGIPVTSDELAERVHILPKQLMKFYQKLKKDFEVPIPPQEHINFVERYASDLDVPHGVMIKAKNVVEKVQSDMIGKKPTGVAGASLYYASENIQNENDQLVYEDIAKNYKVSITTVQKRYYEICKMMEG